MMSHRHPLRLGPLHSLHHSREESSEGQLVGLVVPMDYPVSECLVRHP
jgi:hypothetical protein